MELEQTYGCRSLAGKSAGSGATGLLTCVPLYNPAVNLSRERANEQIARLHWEWEHF